MQFGGCSLEGRRARTPLQFGPRVKGTVWKPVEPGEDRGRRVPLEFAFAWETRAHTHSSGLATVPGRWRATLVHRIVAGGWERGEISLKGVGPCRGSFPKSTQCCSPGHPPPYAPPLFSHSGSVWPRRGPGAVCDHTRRSEVSSSLS